MTRIPARSADAAAIAALAALALVFFGRVLFTQQALFWGDLLRGHYPAYDLWRQAVASGALAVWNPFILGGFPQAADATMGYWYPTVLLHLVLPVHRAMAVDLAVHFFLAGAFTYLFLRRQDISTAAALAGAMIFAFSGFLAVRIAQPPLIRSAAWLPLLLWIVATLDTRPWTRNALALGVTLAAQLLAGHHQTVLISSLLLGCYAVWSAVRRTGARQSALRAAAAMIPVLGLAGLLALVLAAVQLLPAAELSQQSDRSGGMAFEHASLHSLPPEQLPMLLAPNLFGNPAAGRYWGKNLFWEMTGYAGLVSVLLALVGAAASGRRERIFWVGAALAAVALALGRHSPLYWLAYSVVPGLAYFRVRGGRARRLRHGRPALGRASPRGLAVVDGLPGRRGHRRSLLGAGCARGEGGAALARGTGPPGRDPQRLTGRCAAVSSGDRPERRTLGRGDVDPRRGDHRCGPEVGDRLSGWRVCALASGRDRPADVRHEHLSHD